MIKRSFALLTASLLVAVSVSAAGQVAKDEVVYARLSADGAPRAVYIVNAFESEQRAQVMDYGQYLSVESLSGSEALTYEEEMVSFTMDAGRFYYQGIPESTELPWQLRIAYSLDGRQIHAALLSGVEGRLQIDIDVMPDPRFAAFTEGSVLQLTVTLDGDRCLDVQAEHASVALSGGNRVLNFQVFSGMEAHYTVTADVHDFFMDGIQAVGVKATMDADMIRKMAEGRLASSPLATMAGGFIDGFLKDFSGSPSESFADSRNGKVQMVQFVLLCDGISQRDPHPQNKEETQVPEETLWDRVRKLFGG